MLKSEPSAKEAKKIIHPQATPIARGKRLKILRKMTGLSRRAIEEKHAINANTLQNWEDGKSGGLNERGVKRIILALREEGILCNANWLLLGIGAKPYFSEKLCQIESLVESNAVVTTFQDQEEIIINELILFRQHHPNCIDLVIADDGMYPHFQIGDLIAGQRLRMDDIGLVYGSICIVELVTGDVLLRLVRPGNLAGRYTLLCLNLATYIQEPVLYNIELLGIAPVLWQRRRKSPLLA